ncbi:MAG: metallophosphoesterase family protein, partial [bacterium]
MFNNYTIKEKIRYLDRRWKLLFLFPALYVFYKLFFPLGLQGISSPRRRSEYIVRQVTRKENSPYVIDLSGSVSGRFRFCVLGDSGSDSASQRMIADRMLGRSPEFILHTGDLAYYRDRKYEFENNFIKVYKRFRKIRFYPALGNHDYLHNFGAVFFSYFSYLPNRYYQLRTGLVDFFALDSNSLLLGRNLDPDQIDWLKSRLRKSNRRWKVVYLHHPLFSSGQHGDHQPLIDALKKIFEQAGVNLVLSGHDHDYERLKVINGVRYLVTGGGGGTVRKQKRLDNPYSELFLPKYHFLTMTV